MERLFPLPVIPLISSKPNDLLRKWQVLRYGWVDETPPTNQGRLRYCTTHGDGFANLLNNDDANDKQYTEI